MKAMHSAPPGKAWRIGKGPFVFSGVPPVCTGELELINDSEEKVKVRAIAVSHKKGSPAARVLGDVQVGARMAPHEHMRVPAQFLIAPGTPAGIYETVLTCGAQREPAAVHVFDNTALEISPQSIVLRGAAGEKLTQDLVMRNTGNVALTVPDVSMVWLEERDWVGRTLVQTLRESPEAERHQEFLDRVLGDLRSSLIPPSRVLFEGTSLIVEPGQVAQLRLGLTLPKELKPRRTYVGFVKLPSRRVWLRIECDGTVKSKSRRRK